LYPAQRDGADTQPGERFKAGTIGLIVDEYAHGLGAPGRRSGARAQPEFVEAPGNCLGPWRARKALAVVGFCVVDGGLDHGAPPSSRAEARVAAR